MSYKIAFSALAIILTFVAFVPYIHSILKAQTKPHFFSWLIWGVTTVVVGIAQWSEKGGAGSWPTIISGMITLGIAWLALSRSPLSATRSDWFFLVSSFLALPFWVYSESPLITVLILTTIDLFGFGPTFRKAYAEPYSEHLNLYYIMVLRNSIAIAALETYNVTTVIFPAAIAILTVIFIAMVLVRRKQIV